MILKLIIFIIVLLLWALSSGEDNSKIELNK